MEAKAPANPRGVLINALLGPITLIVLGIIFGTFMWYEEFFNPDIHLTEPEISATLVAKGDGFTGLNYDSFFISNREFQTFVTKMLGREMSGPNGDILIGDFVYTHPNLCFISALDCKSSLDWGWGYEAFKTFAPTRCISNQDADVLGQTLKEKDKPIYNGHWYNGFIIWTCGEDGAKKVFGQYVQYQAELLSKDF